jgi:hypothetical protein
VRDFLYRLGARDLRTELTSAHHGYPYGDFNGYDFACVIRDPVQIVASYYCYRRDKCSAKYPCPIKFAEQYDDRDFSHNGRLFYLAARWGVQHLLYPDLGNELCSFLEQYGFYFKPQHLCLPWSGRTNCGPVADNPEFAAAVRSRFPEDVELWEKRQ